MWPHFRSITSSKKESRGDPEGSVPCLLPALRLVEAGERCQWAGVSMRGVLGRVLRCGWRLTRKHEMGTKSLPLLTRYPDVNMGSVNRW